MTERKQSCPTRMVLMTAWQNASEAYSKTVAELTKQIGVLTKADYEKFRERAEKARQRSIQAQADLDAHIQDHGCDGNGEAAA